MEAGHPLLVLSFVSDGELDLDAVLVVLVASELDVLEARVVDLELLLLVWSFVSLLRLACSHM